MTSDRKTLEPFKEVLKRQKPVTPGEPFTMKVFQNSLPKAVGNPWRGAYSKHGFWYRIHEGDDTDFGELAALAVDQDKYMLGYDYLNCWQKAYGRENVRVLVAKNLRNEIMGGVAAIKKNDYTQIGVYFVKEEFRHSGIGSVLFRNIAGDAPIVFQAMHHLLPTVSSFGLSKRFSRQFVHVKVNRPSGFADLLVTSEGWRVETNEGNRSLDWTSIAELDFDVTAEKRPLTSLFSMEGSTVGAVFDEKSKCLGYGVCRELAGGSVKRLLVGPLLTKNSAVAEVILRAVLKQYYNPEEDYDFDPDVFAIYRRSVEFVLPLHEALMSTVKKLSGKEGELTRERMWYQTCSSCSIPEVQMAMVYAAGDLHSALI
ncbi:hypothetical protein Q1695_009388 [Nippostrongylus brasiliensis]|nr:hypothetical protein Q1695_009388 [Nippostrongylus brasiliensis]